VTARHVSRVGGRIFACVVTAARTAIAPLDGWRKTTGCGTHPLRFARHTVSTTWLEHRNILPATAPYLSPYPPPSPSNPYYLFMPRHKLAHARNSNKRVCDERTRVRTNAEDALSPATWRARRGYSGLAKGALALAYFILSQHVTSWLSISSRLLAALQTLDGRSVVEMPPTNRRMLRRRA